MILRGGAIGRTEAKRAVSRRTFKGFFFEKQLQVVWERKQWNKNRLNVWQSGAVAQLNLRIDILTICLSLTRPTKVFTLVKSLTKTSPLIVLSSSLTASMALGQVRQKRRAEESVLPGRMMVLKGSHDML